MFRLSILLSSLLFSLSTIAQTPPAGQAREARPEGPTTTGRITGTVIDSITGEPVDFATIVLYATGTDRIVDGSVTDESGAFRLTDVRTGDYDLQISFLGYRMRVHSVSLTPRNPDYNAGTVFLTPDQIMLQEVEVVSDAPIIESRVDRIVYNAERDLTTLGGDATDVLRKVPLLSVDIDGNVSLRGSSNLQILINNRPSGMFASDVAEALKMIPADQIASVEVITAPGARYDAEGTAGIINIVTKRRTAQGISAGINSTIGTRHNRQLLNLSAGAGRLGLTAGASAHYGWPATGTSEFYREDNTQGETRLFTQNGSSKASRLGINGNAGLFYDINAFNSISTSFSVRGFRFNNDSYLQSEFIDPVNAIEDIFTQDNTGRRGRNSWEWNSDYTRRFQRQGQELVFAFQVNGNYNNQRNTLDRTGSTETPESRLQNRNKGENLEYSLQLDYAHPFNKRFTLESGLKGVLRDIDSDFSTNVFDFETLLYNRDPARSDLFDYKQDIYSGYVSARKEFAGDYQLQAGVRYEYTLISGDFRDAPSPFSNSYGNLIPSIALSKKIKEFNTLRISYNQRLQRPRLQNINPFISIENERNIEYGNPALDPEISHQFEIGYTTFIKGSVVNMSAYYRHTTDEINSILEVTGEGISVTTFRNIGLSHNYGINLFGSTTIGRNLTLRGSIDAFAFDIRSTVPGLDLSNSGFQYRGRLNGSYRFGSGFTAEMFGFFNSPRRTVQGQRTSWSMLNFGVKKELFERRGSLGISISQPFKEYRAFRTELRGDDFYQFNETLRPMRSIGLTFSYQIGRLDFDRPQQRSRRGGRDRDRGADDMIGIEENGDM